MRNAEPGTVRSVKPIAFRTAISRVRSRAAIIIVFIETSMIAITIAVPTA